MEIARLVVIVCGTVLDSDIPSVQAAERGFSFRVT